MLKRTAILLLVSTAALAEEPAVATKSATAAVPGRFDIGALDRSVDPCVDFYQFACGGWRAKNPIPPDQTPWGRFNELAERNREDLHQILEKAKEPSAKRSALEAKVGDFYASCMDEAGIEALGTKPIAPALARIAALSSKRELFALLGEHEATGLPTLFRFGAAPDLHDSKQTIASLGQGGIGLPDRDDYLKDDAKSKETRDKYVEHVARTLAPGDSAPRRRRRARRGTATRDRHRGRLPRPRRDAGSQNRGVPR
jgi:predicted metalloendopeptidase